MARAELRDTRASRHSVHVRCAVLRWVERRVPLPESVSAAARGVSETSFDRVTSEQVSIVAIDRAVPLPRPTGRGRSRRSIQSAIVVFNPG